MHTDRCGLSNQKHHARGMPAKKGDVLCKYQLFISQYEVAISMSVN